MVSSNVDRRRKNLRQIAVLIGTLVIAGAMALAFRFAVVRLESWLSASRDVATLSRLAAELRMVENETGVGDVGQAEGLRRLGDVRLRMMDAAKLLSDKQDLDPGLPALVVAAESSVAAAARIVDAMGRGNVDDAGAAAAAAAPGLLALDAAVRRAESGLLDSEIGLLDRGGSQVLLVLFLGALIISAIGLRIVGTVERSEERFRAFTEHATDLLWVVEPGGRVQYRTPSVLRSVGGAGGDVGSVFFDAVHPDDVERAHAFISHIHAQPGAVHTFEGRFHGDRPEGTHLEVIGHNLIDSPSVRGIVLNARDVTERTAREEALRHDALHDTLTDLPNRALFMDRIRSTLAACGHDPALTFAVIYLDLDGFKGINDTRGHAAGDALLVAVARRLSDTVRILGRAAPDAGGSASAPRRAPGTDTLARVGGDEFVVQLNHTKNYTNALAAATRILSAINTPFAIEGREVTISASVGVAVGPGQYTGADPLVRDADVAMYRAKAAGRSQIKMFDPTMQAEASRQMAHRGQLRAAVARQDFVVLFQPIVSVDTHRLQGFEALLRWRHEGTLVPPADFLPLAEETGLIVSLGRWAMEHACRQARVWRVAHPELPAGVMTINVSQRELADGEFLTHLGRAVSEAGIDPTDLRIEFTENVALQDPAHVLALIRQLRLRGHRVSMDGFGVGHSLLSWFDQLPFDGFKLDGSFVRNLDTSARSLNVVRLVVELAKEGGIELVAEGVETERQVEILRTLGCTLHQGYFFAEPQEAAQLDRTFVHLWT